MCSKAADVVEWSQLSVCRGIGIWGKGWAIHILYHVSGTLTL